MVDVPSVGKKTEFKEPRIVSLHFASSSSTFSFYASLPLEIRLAPFRLVLLDYFSVFQINTLIEAFVF